MGVQGSRSVQPCTAQPLGLVPQPSAGFFHPAHCPHSVGTPGRLQISEFLQMGYRKMWENLFKKRGGFNGKTWKKIMENPTKMEIQSWENHPNEDVQTVQLIAEG